MESHTLLVLRWVECKDRASELGTSISVDAMGFYINGKYASSNLDGLNGYLKGLAEGKIGDSK